MCIPADVQEEADALAGVGPTAVDVDGADLALVSVRQPAVAGGLSPVPCPAPPHQDQPQRVGTKLFIYFCFLLYRADIREEI